MAQASSIVGSLLLRVFLLTCIYSHQMSLWLFSKLSFESVFFTVVSVATLYLFFKASLTDPGFVDVCPSAYISILEKYRGGRFMTEKEIEDHVKSHSISTKELEELSFSIDPENSICSKYHIESRSSTSSGPDIPAARQKDKFMLKAYPLKTHRLNPIFPGNQISTNSARSDDSWISLSNDSLEGFLDTNIPRCVAIEVKEEWNSQISLKSELIKQPLASRPAKREEEVPGSNSDYESTLGNELRSKTPTLHRPTSGESEYQGLCERDETFGKKFYLGVTGSTLGSVQPSTFRHQSGEIQQCGRIQVVSECELRSDELREQTVISAKIGSSITSASSAIAPVVPDRIVKLLASSLLAVADKARGTIKCYAHYVFRNNSRFESQKLEQGELTCPDSNVQRNFVGIEASLESRKLSHFSLKRDSFNNNPHLTQDKIKNIFESTSSIYNYHNVLWKSEKDPCVYQGGIPLRFCVICWKYQPLRAKHCSECGKCVRTMDHHCPWIGTCVGEKNRFWFFWFLVFQAIELTWGLCACARSLKKAVKETMKPQFFAASQPAPNIFKLILYFTYLLCGNMTIITLDLMVFCLIGYHSFLASANLTTWENQAWDRISYLKEYPRILGSPFSRGFLRNINVYCCSTLKGRKKFPLLPVLYGPQDEIIWQYCK